MEHILKRIAMITGFLVLTISIFFSYDGFDQSVTGGNNGYTTLAKVIGITLAIVFTVIEFIFGTNYKDLNWTLRGVGVFAYIYSIYTNFLGIQHVLGADPFMAWSLAMIIDVYPEPAISWAMGTSLVGDLLGNLGKMVFGAPHQSDYGFRQNLQKNFQTTPQSQHKHNGERRGVEWANQRNQKHGDKKIPFPVFRKEE
jgi:hypothetical protein